MLVYLFSIIVIVVPLWLVGADIADRLEQARNAYEERDCPPENMGLVIGKRGAGDGVSLV